MCECAVGYNYCVCECAVGYNYCVCECAVGYNYCVCECAVGYNYCVYECAVGFTIHNLKEREIMEVLRVYLKLETFAVLDTHRTLSGTGPEYCQ